MNRCKVATRLAGEMNKKADIAISTGYNEDVINAHAEYVNHIEGHGCWRCE